jgi:hypothetical protein
MSVFTSPGSTQKEEIIRKRLPHIFKSHYIVTIYKVIIYTVVHSDFMLAYYIYYINTHI